MKRAFTLIVFASLAASPLAAQQPTPPAQSASGWVGITYSGSGQTDREGNLVFDEYPVVVSVDPGSPAAKAGIMAGDTIIAFNDRDLRKYALPVRNMIEPGRIFVLRSRRASGNRTSKITVARRPSDHPERLEIAIHTLTPGDTRAAMAALTPIAPPAPVNAIVRVAVPGIGTVYGSASPMIAGAELRKLTAEFAEILGVKPQGLLVVNVVGGSPAEESGIRGGDVLLRAETASLLTPQDLIKVMREVADKRVSVELVRKRKVQTILLRW